LPERLRCFFEPGQPRRLERRTDGARQRPGAAAWLERSLAPALAREPIQNAGQRGARHDG